MATGNKVVSINKKNDAPARKVASVEDVETELDATQALIERVRRHLQNGDSRDAANALRGIELVRDSLREAEQMIKEWAS